VNLKKKSTEPNSKQCQDPKKKKKKKNTQNTTPRLPWASSEQIPPPRNKEKINVFERPGHLSSLSSSFWGGFKKTGADPNGGMDALY